MANYKTITLGGTEQKVNISGQNCDIRNDGTDIIYASNKTPIIAGEDGVLSIPAGQAAKLLDSTGTVYLLGTGAAVLCGNDYGYLVFKSAASASGGGGTEDTIARTAINAHAGNSDIHFTAEKAIEAAATTISNRNIADNADFSINQRGLAEYTEIGYTVDRWHKPYANTTIKVTENGIEIVSNNAITANECALREIFTENVNKWRGKTITFSAKVTQTHAAAAMAIVCSTVAGANNPAKTTLSTGINSVTLTIPDEEIKLMDIRFVVNAGSVAGDTFAVEWVKFEIGSAATPFVPPNHAEELAKCQRYYQIRSTGDIDPVDLRPSMATITDIRQREDGNYEYIAELR